MSSSNICPTSVIAFINGWNRHQMKNKYTFKDNTNNTSVIIFFFNWKVKNSQRWYFGWENFRGGFCYVSCIFISLLYLHFIFVSSFHFWSSFCSSFHFQAAFPFHRHPTLASQVCEGLHQLWALPRQLSIAFAFASTASATVLSGRFLPTGVFYLMLLHWHFWFNLRLLRPHWELVVLSWSLQGLILIFKT